MQQQRVQPRKPRRDETSAYRPRVVVKFHDYITLPYKKGVESEFERREIGPWTELSERFPGIHLTPLYQDLSPDEITGMVGLATQLDRTYKPPNMLTYFAIDCPPGVEAEALAKSVASWRSVQEAYVEGGPTIPPLDDPRQVNQGYEDPAPGA